MIADHFTRVQLKILGVGVLLILAPFCSAATDTPPRDPDGRVSPTTMPAKWKTQDERAQQIEKANALRNELLAKFPQPVVLCKRVADDAITVDGKLDEPAWQRAAVIDVLRNPKGGKPNVEKTTVRLLWDSKYLHVAFECTDRDIIGELRDHDAELWREDAAEIFINPSGDEMSYVEFELNPINTFYDGAIAEYRPEVDWDINAGHLDMDRTIVTYRATDSEHGTAKIDGGWTCEMAIAFTDIARGANVVRPFPQDGDIWRAGIYRINASRKPGGKPDDREYELGAWNPTGTWFHRPWMFGRVVFLDDAEK